MSNFSWTDEQVDELKRMHAEGLSFSEIGAALGGITRNACIGKARRIGLPMRIDVRRDPTVRRVRASRADPERRIRVRPIVEFIAEDSVIEPIRELPAEAIPQEQRKTFAELKPHHCRFIYGDTLSGDYFYCGGKKYRGAYCAYHHGVTHQPARVSPLERERRRQQNMTAIRIATEAERMTG